MNIFGLRERKIESPGADASNLAEEFKKAEVELNEAMRLQRIANSQRDESLENMAGTQRQIDAAPTAYAREGFQMKLANLRGKTEDSRRKAIDASRLVAEKEAALDYVRAAIEEAPLYRETRTAQRKLIITAIELAEQSWLASLADALVLIKKIESVAEDEFRFVAGVNCKLRAVGLPELNARIGSAIPMITPYFLRDWGLNSLQAEAKRQIITLRNL